jgi:hypothetical protein
MSHRLAISAVNSVHPAANLPNFGSVTLSGPRFATVRYRESDDKTVPGEGALTMRFEPIFVPGGVYLRTPSGEWIGRLDEPGEPFETLEEARSKADSLETILQHQQPQQHRRKAAPLSRRRSLAARKGAARPVQSAVQPAAEGSAPSETPALETHAAEIRSGSHE